MMSAAMSPIANLPISLKIGCILLLSLNIKATVPQIANNGNMIIVPVKTAMCLIREAIGVMAVCFLTEIKKNTPEGVNWCGQEDLNFHEQGS